MPEIKIKHVVSFSSEDKVHKAENMLKSETYRKWKCATPGEKNASVVLQFEKATQIHSIDIGNENSAFVEVLVGRSSDSVNDYQVLLVASSFMSPLESRNETHSNRVRMFGPDALAQNLRNEKWDCVQIVCSQPFNKNITYGLSFIKFLSPPLPASEAEENWTKLETKPHVGKIGAFKLKSEEEDISLPAVGSWFGKRKSLENSPASSFEQESSSYASSVLASANITPKRLSNQGATLKRKHNEIDEMQTKRETPRPNKESREVQSRKELPYPNKEPRQMHNKKESNHPIKEQASREVHLQKSNEKVSEKHSSQGSSFTKMELVKKQKPFNRIMEKVVFVLSGFVNPLRSELRDKAVAMGAKYRTDWDSSSTHLVCAYLNTPKYIQVRAAGGRVVRKDWINDCHKRKILLPWRKYMLGKYSKESTDESDSDHEPAVAKPSTSTEKKVAKPRSIQAKSSLNGNSPLREKGISEKPFGQNAGLDNSEPSSSKAKNLNLSANIKDESETEDEDALADYMADTDAESDSGGNTEDEILKVESKIARKGLNNTAGKIKTELKKAVESKVFEKPNIDNLPLPDLPNLFKSKHFFLYGDFTPKKHHELQRYVAAYNGVIEDYMSQNVKYVITEAKWDKKFEEALEENEDLIFVKPQWIYKCHEARKIVPYQPFIIIPDS